MQTTARVLDTRLRSRYVVCAGLRYSARMDLRRKKLGDFIRVDREWRGYKSRKAFGDAVGLSERSIAAVERGEDVGRKVLNAVERGLDMPLNAAVQFIESGDVSLLQRATTGPGSPEPQRSDAEKLAELNRRVAESLAEAAEFQRQVGEILKRQQERGA